MPQPDSRSGSSSKRPETAPAGTPAAQSSEDENARPESNSEGLSAVFKGIGALKHILDTRQITPEDERRSLRGLYVLITIIGSMHVVNMHSQNSAAEDSSAKLDAHGHQLEILTDRVAHMEGKLDAVIQLHAEAETKRKIAEAHADASTAKTATTVTVTPPAPRAIVATGTAH